LNYLVKKITFLLKLLSDDDIRREFLFLYVRRYPKMDNWTFGTTMVVVGMGGTLLTLWLLSLLMSFLKRIFPYTTEEK
jgi:hypothetical protein